MGYYVYILKCSDNSYYTGSTKHLQRRLVEHQVGKVEGYTSSRLPVELVWCAEFPSEHDALLRERQIKGGSRAKKEALIRNDWAKLQEIVKAEHLRRDVPITY